MAGIYINIHIKFEDLINGQQEMSSSACYQIQLLRSLEYKSIYSLQGDTMIITIIILSAIVPLQLLFTILFCIYSSRKKRPTIEPKQDQNSKATKPFLQQNEQKGDNRNNSKPPNKFIICVQKIFNNLETSVISCASKNKLRVLSFFIIIPMIASIVLLSISIVASEQALLRKFSEAQCTLSSKVSSFVNGTQKWTGLSNLIPNVTKLQLNLNTRIKATKNAIQALVLNGTNATNPIGFPNGTRIGDTITGTLVTTNSIQSYIDVALRQWLFRNSSLSSTYRFPICQGSSVYLMPHPLNDNQSIQLNYMNSICNNLTQEVNSLVKNGKAIDDLLTLTTSVQNSTTSISNNLTFLKSSYQNYGPRSNQYQLQFSKTGIQVNSYRVVPYILIGLNGLAFIGTVIYLIYQSCQMNKSYRQEEVKMRVREVAMQKGEAITKNEIISQKNMKNIDIENISISDQSYMSETELKIKRDAKIRQLIRKGFFTHSKSTHALNIGYLLITLAIGFSSFAYSNSINTSRTYCQNFNSGIQDGTLSQSLKLSSTQSALLSPVEKCLTNKLGASLSNDHFLQSIQTHGQLLSVEKLYNITKTYNLSTPQNVFSSVSLQQIQILKNYLLHMQTMPVKSANFTLRSIIDDLNTYTNGTSLLSKQVSLCGSSLLKDQYVYNVVDCQYPLITYSTESQVTQPRCLQIPTWEGSGGSKDADLNDAQHTIQLNTTCPTLNDFFNGSNTACFLGKRLQTLRAANCTSVATQYNRRLKNLIKFSVETGSFTNSYLQNLRNYIGVYAVLNSNITQFFNGANTSAVLSQFGTLSNNLLNKTSCSYVRESISEIYSSYCPQQNKISMLLYDSYVFNFIGFGLLSLSWGFLIIWQVIANGYLKAPFLINKYIQYLKKNNRKTSKNGHMKKDKHQMEIQRKRNKLEISEQTLKNQEDASNSHAKHENILNQQFNQGQEENQNQNSDNDRQDSMISQKFHLNVLDHPPNNLRTLQPEEKQESSNQSENESENNTEINQAKYQYENIEIQETGKKLLTKPNVEDLEQNENGDLFNIKNQIDGLDKDTPSNLNITNNIKNQLVTKSHEIELSRDTRQIKQTVSKKKVLGKNRRQIDFSDSNDGVLDVVEKKAPFFNQERKQKYLKIETDSRKSDFTKESIKKQRKVQSKSEARQQFETVKQYRPPRSISKVTKQGRQVERLKIVKLDQIVKETIQVVDIKESESQRKQADQDRNNQAFEG